MSEVLSIDEMRSQLEGAGWTAKTSVVWRAPNGTLWLGPAGAWLAMKRVSSMRGKRDDERARIINRAMRLRVDIEQIFTDCASWNDNARKPDDAPIDPDEDGKLRRMADGLDQMLTLEADRQVVAADQERGR